MENSVVTGFVLVEPRADPEAEDDGNNQENSSRLRRHHRQLFVEGCDAESYYTTMLAKDNLFATYKTEASKETSTKSILERDVLLQICQAESKTHEVLQEKGLCGGCDDNYKCLPPHSLILVLRMYLNAMDSTCSELMDKYTEDIQVDFTETLEECVNEIYENYDSTTQSYGVTTKCPDLFQVNLVDKEFAKNGNTFLRYSSSYFITHEVDEQDLYDARPLYGSTDESIVTSLYDTLTEAQTEIYSETLIIPDMVSLYFCIKICENERFQLNPNTLLIDFGFRIFDDHIYCYGNTYEIDVVDNGWSNADYFFCSSCSFCLCLHCWNRFVSLISLRIIFLNYVLLISIQLQ